VATPVEIARANGVVIPEIAWDASRAVGVPYWATCAFLIQESSGGHNIFGHDSGCPFYGAGTVTEAKYKAFTVERDAQGRSQGVGPMQLTWRGFQDQADAMGGCWKPMINVTVGLKALKSSIDAGKTWHEAARIYNGAEAYADQMDGRFELWKQLLAHADEQPDHRGDAERPHDTRHHPAGHPYEQVTWRGRTYDKMTVAAILSAEERLGFQVIITQGSYNTTVQASGNTHAGGGALDIHYDPTTSDKIVRAFRETGFATWRRFAIEGLWPDHIHALLLNNAEASDQAKLQWQDYRDRLDGLPAGVPSEEGPDLGPRLDPIPTFHYSAEPQWPKLHTTSKEIGDMQRKLRIAGYYHGGDKVNYYGNHTRAAIKVFQQAQHWVGADADGLLGPVTWARIQALPAEAPPAKKSARHSPAKKTAPSPPAKKTAPKPPAKKAAPHPPAKKAAPHPPAKKAAPPKRPDDDREPEQPPAAGQEPSETEQYAAD